MNISSEEEMSEGDILGELAMFCRHRNWENVSSYWENMHSVLGKYSKNSLGEAAFLRLQNQPNKSLVTRPTMHPPQILREWFHFVQESLLSGKSFVTSTNIGMFYFLAIFQDGRRRQICATLKKKKYIITFLFSDQIFQMRYQNDRNK
jgi:hypothetical protein